MASSRALEDAVEQPLTFGLDYGSEPLPLLLPPPSPPPPPQPPPPPLSSALLLDCRRLWMPRMSTAEQQLQLQQQQQQQPSVEMSEEAYRTWLTLRYHRHFQPYSHLGGMPNRVFLDTFAGRDLRRAAKLARLLRHAERNRESRITWPEFYASMTYRLRCEMPTSRRALNCLVKAADPGASMAERRLRSDAERRGEAVPSEAYIEFYRCHPPPIFVPLLALSLLIAFCVCAVQLNAGPAGNQVGWATGLPYASVMAFCPAKRHEVWRFLSYALLNHGWHHLVISLLLLLCLGLPLQLAHGTLRIGAIFIGGVLLGSLLSSLADQGAVLVGASGGTSALVGAHIALALINWRQLREEWMDMTTGGVKKTAAARARLVLGSGMLRIAMLTALAYADFGVAVYQRYTEVASRASFVAHPAGLAWGCLFGVHLIRRVLDDPAAASTVAGDATDDGEPPDGCCGSCDMRCQRRLFCGSLATFVAFAVFAISWNLFYPGFPTELPCSVGGVRI